MLVRVPSEVLVSIPSEMVVRGGYFFKFFYFKIQYMCFTRNLSFQAYPEQAATSSAYLQNALRGPDLSRAA